METEAPSFLWRPGEGCDAVALQRLCDAFPRPDALMGEAWFMSDPRRMYPELSGDLDALTVQQLKDAFEEIGCGPPAFGPRKEWTEWFHYLLPRVLSRAHESFVDPLLETLVTAFIAQHPAGLPPEPYPGFRLDALQTLGRCLMDPICWPDGQLDLAVGLHKSFNPRVGSFFFWDASKLSSAMFFCLKYLCGPEVAPWLQSVLVIPDPYWRGQLMVWMVGAHPLLVGAGQPSDLPYAGAPNVSWDWSHVLKGNYTGDLSDAAAVSEFLPAENRVRTVETIRRLLTEAVYLEWLDSIAGINSLELELLDIPFELHRLYLAEAR